jgi:hypothetical protein
MLYAKCDVCIYECSKSHHYNPSKSFTSETVGDGAIMFDLK